MAKEIQAKQYYIHYSYIPTYYFLYKSLEKWLEDRIFRGDASRVFCASNNYAFRRRFELTDTSKNYKDIEVSSLQFPFANYWPQNNGWQVDTRPAGNPAPLIYTGIYEGLTKIRASSGNLTIPVTFYFDREDDARMAYEKLYFYTYNEHNYSTDAVYANQILELPIIISIQNLRFNPNYIESDWLKQNRIFIVTIDAVVRSYFLFPPQQPPYDVDVNSLGLLPDGIQYDDGSESYLPVEEAILDMQSYFGLDMDRVTVTGKVEESNIEINLLSIANITSDSATLKWEINNLDQVEKMVIKYDGSKDWTEVDPSLGIYQLMNLQADSIYNIYLNIYGKDGIPKRIGKTFETPGVEEVPKEDQNQAPINSLVGISW